MAYDAREQVSTRLAGVPLDGVFRGCRFLVKDMVDVAGLRRTDGSRLLATAPVAPESVDYIAAIERAGLIPIGSTNAPEFASLSITANQLFGATRNPWHLDFSTFTSSGGTAPQRSQQGSYRSHTVQTARVPVACRHQRSAF